MARKVKSANRRELLLELGPDLLKKLDPEVAAALNDRFKRLQEVIPAGAGLRGQVNIANTLAMEENQIKEVADPVDDLDAVNFRTLKKYIDCEFLVELLEDCDEFAELLDDEDDAEPDPAPAAPAPNIDLFWGGSVMLPTNMGNAGIVTFNNEVLVTGFYLPFQCTVTKMSVELLAAVGGANFFGGALYDSGGNLIMETGALSDSGVAAQVYTTAIASTQVDEGFYYAAQTATHGGGNFRLIITQTSSNIMNNSGALRKGVAANVAVGGVFPATLGAITARSFETLAILFE